MNDVYFKELDERVTQVSSFFAQSTKQWNELVDDSDSGDTEATETLLNSLQLLLQYRLNGEDMLAELLNLDHHLLYILGIQAQHGRAVNMERLSYALGSDDLKAVLHALNQLVDKLLRMARRYQKLQEQSKPRHSPISEAKKSPALSKIQKQVMQQESALELIRQISKQLSQYPKAGAPDYAPNRLAILRGSMAQWQQSLRQGLEQAQRIYQKQNKDQVLDQSLAALIQQADLVLKHMPTVYQPSANNALGYFASKSSEELEQRAAAKRMRPFF